MAKYSVQQHTIDTLLSWVKSGQIAIPEMQRPFVWDSTKVRDLLDSLYRGFPIGYLITWQSTDVGLKDGSASNFKQILIDGQQRITAMTAAIVGQKVVNKKYEKKRITIAFNPVTEQFATLTPILERDSEWISDVADFLGAPGTFTAVREYLEANPEIDTATVERSLQQLAEIRTSQVGIITLAEELDIETVTEIFIRINSKGVPLSSADFAMSKIASHGDFGSALRKLIDYFSHLSVAPHVYDDIEANDREFATSDYLAKLAWLKNDSSDLYDPSYTDVIRVATLKEFKRGKVAALVSLLSGRDFETRKFDEQIAVESFSRLEKVLLEIVNEFTFKQFVMTIQSAGFISPKLIGSKNALNFAYALYLHLKTDSPLPDGAVKHYVRRWFVMSIITARYTTSVETRFENDMRRISENGVKAALDEVEDSELSDVFWSARLPRQLESSSTRTLAPFRAAQIHRGARGFLSKSITVASMTDERGDIHHLVPKNYLIKNGIVDRGQYNQIANYALTETPINIGIKDRTPASYMGIIDNQISTRTMVLGEIVDEDDLRRNLAENAVPESLRTTTVDSYSDFLEERRKLISAYIREYYESL